MKLWKETMPRGAGHDVLRRSLPLLKPYRWRLLAGGVFIAFTAFTLSVMPLFTKQVIDVAIPRRDFLLALLTMGAFVVLMMLRMASWYSGQSLLFPVRERVIFKLRSLVFARMQELCLRFHQRYSPGFLYDRALGGASTAIGTFLTMLFNTVVTYICTLAFSLVFCLRLHAGMTLAVLVMSIGYVFISRYFGRRIHAMTSEFNRKVNEFAGKVTDLLRGIRTIKAFALEQRVVSEFDEELWPLQLRSLDLNLETMRMSFVSEGLGYLINAMVTVAGAYFVIGGEVQLGTLVAFIAYQGMMTGIIGALSTVTGTYAAAMAGLEQIYEVLDEQPTVVERPGAVMPARAVGQVDFEAVTFAYEDRPVITDLTVQVPAGQSVALVGPSGGGKTTVINLLLRFYDPDHGRILLDGRDIRDLPLTGYHNLFGVVLQDPFLFNDTIYNNLRSVAPEASDGEIRRALERAQAWEFVSQLKGGWHFNVGEGGGQLSGGQRQRIAIARCFLTNPRILVLDEATSALDNQSELLVQQALQEVMRERTTFIIAHRLSTVRHVDRVLVLQDGRLVQDGTFDSLSRTPGLFQDLATAWVQVAVPEAG
ncbi:MAG: ABC transporter ATP-binding protein [Armatimonadota bacterium]